MHEIVRTLGNVMTAPVTVGLSMLHDWATGRDAILDISLERAEDLLARQQLIHRLRAAGKNPRVVAILLRVRQAPGSWAACQDLRHALAGLREGGTRVYAWVEAPGNALLWLATATDRVFMPPTGEVALVGVGLELTFFGQAFAKLGIEPDFEAAGAYKSFGEPWTRSFASPANQEAVSALVQGLHRQLLDDIAADRGLDAETLAGLVDRAPLSARDAQEAGLVDELVYPDQLRTWLEEEHGKASHLVSWATFAARDAAVEWSKKAFRGGPSVAVVHMDGPIVMDGPKSATQIRGRQVVELLRTIREDDSIKAVVLHVNSPGGSALASDLMWREVQAINNDKPVVAVFEDVAASGGYYLSAAATEILARPATLTGSIGVFGGKIVVGEGLRRLGVTTQEISEAPNANMLSPTRRFSPQQRERFRESLQRFYDGFVQRVAEGRNRSEEEVEPHCRGRVWTGRDASERGLVDRFGDVYDGIERARILAELPATGWRRRDFITWRRKTMIQKSIQRAIRGAVGPQVARGLRVLEGLGLGKLSASLEVVLSHEGQALAMLPWEIYESP